MRERAIFGDFQTPAELAEALVAFAARRYGEPDLVLEPTVGEGTILRAAMARFASARGVGVDRDRVHLGTATRTLAVHADRCALFEGDMFSFDYRANIDGGRLAILGNPPWVTNSAMAGLGGDNLPKRSNGERLRGLDAKTGRSNFDVAEWLLAELVRSFAERDAYVAVLVKTQVARRILRWAEAHDAPIADLSVAAIDAARWFGASVDACAFGFRLGRSAGARDVAWYDSLQASEPSRTMGMRQGVLFADVTDASLLRLVTTVPNGAFRSGVKHDAADVFELVSNGGVLRNGYDAEVRVEESVRFPFVKGGDLGRARPKVRELVLPQRALGEDTARLATDAPAAFAYLESNGARLDARKSSIYVGRPRFSVFGIGDYSFAPYKVAVFGLAKVATFVVLGPRDGRPVLLDDTAYFVPCADEPTANALTAVLASALATRLFTALVFPDSKRPITKELLSRIDLAELADRARALGQVSVPDAERVRTLARSLVETGQVSNVSPSQHSA